MKKRFVKRFIQSLVREMRAIKVPSSQKTVSKISHNSLAVRHISFHIYHME